MLLLFCLVLLVLVYIKHKLTHLFWSAQPVCFRLKFLNQKQGVITDELPRTKWLDLQQTLIVTGENTQLRNDICKFVTNNSRKTLTASSTNQTTIAATDVFKNIEYYLVNHSFPVYFGVYRKSLQVKDILVDEIPEYDNIAGVITAIPLNFTVFKKGDKLNIHNKKVNLLNYLYYVDNLVVDAEHRNKKLRVN